MVTSVQTTMNRPYWLFVFVCSVCFATNVVGQNCIPTPIGLEDGSFPDGQIFASGDNGIGFGAECGRLNRTNIGGCNADSAWVADSSVPPSDKFWAVDLGSNLYVTGVDMQGRALANEWVSSVTITTSFDNVVESTYGTFASNVDSTSVVSYRNIDTEARYVYLRPQAVNGWPSLRAEVYVCEGAVRPSLTTTDIGATTVDFSWTPKVQSLCVFFEWTIEYSASGSGPVLGCTGLFAYGTTSCQAYNLNQGTTYGFRIRETCTDSTRNSLWTNLTVTTQIAPEPPIVSAVAATTSRIDISWVPQAANDCTFSQWRVQYAEGDKTGNVAGCTGLTSRLAQSCTATGLTMGVSYSFHVVESCLESFESDPGTMGLLTKTLVRADPPQAVTASNIGFTTLDLQWIASFQNNCTFQSWEVEFDVGGTGTPLGCTGLLTFGSPSCSVTGLLPGTVYSFKVRQTCTNSADNVDSLDSLSSTVVQTLAIATAPTSVTASTLDSSSASLSWVAGAAQSCTFSSWSVLDGYSDPVFGCTGNTLRSVTSCIGTGLTPATSYNFTVREVCTNSLFDSDPSVVSNSIQTLKPAVQPTVSVSNIFTNSLDINWVASNSSTDCVFSRWEVQYSSGGVGTPFGCSGLNSRTVTSCSVSGLQSGVIYSFTVEEQCQNLQDLYSGPSIASTPSATLVKAGKPTIWCGNATNTQLELSWSPGPSNGCIFDSYLVTYVTGGTGSPCSGLTDRSVTRCTASALARDQTYSFAVQEICTNSHAGVNSDTSDESNVGLTIDSADQPSALSITGVSDVSLTFSWIPGNPNTCIFSHWELFNGALYACTGQLTDRSVTTCVDNSFTPATDYTFRVREVCTDTDYDSVFSPDSNTVQTLTGPTAPTGINVGNATFYGVDLGFQSGTPNDCIFDHWQVKFYGNVLLVNGGSGIAGGCTSNSRTETACTLTGLRDGFTYTFTVSEVCTNTLPSPESVHSQPVITTAEIPLARDISASLQPASQVVVQLQPYSSYTNHLEIVTVPDEGALYQMAYNYYHHGYQRIRGLTPIAPGDWVSDPNHRVVYVSDLDFDASHTFEYVTVADNAAVSEVATCYLTPEETVSTSDFSRASSSANDWRAVAYNITYPISWAGDISNDFDYFAYWGTQQSPISDKRWYFLAPVSWNGNQASSYGGKIEFTVGMIIGDASLTRTEVVPLVSIHCSSCEGGNSAIYQVGTYSLVQRQEFSFDLIGDSSSTSSTAWRVDPGDDRIPFSLWPSASECEVWRVLHSIESIRIYGDLTTAYEVTGIDEARVSVPLHGTDIPISCYEEAYRIYFT